MNFQQTKTQLRNPHILLFAFFFALLINSTHAIMCKSDTLSTKNALTATPLPKTAGKPSSVATIDAKDDHRPVIQDLLEEHADTIVAVREAIRSDTEGQPLFDANTERYDDLWILRYVLSHKGNVPKASKAAVKTLKFRAEWKLNEQGDLRNRLRNYGDERESGDSDIPKLPHYDLWNRFMGPHTMVALQPDPDRGVLMYWDFGQWDIDRMVNEMTEEEYRTGHLYKNEAIYQILDEVTRRTGRLTKLTRIVDGRNIHYGQFNRRYIHREREVQNELECLYPQLLEKMYLYHLPGWLRAVWKIAMTIFPARVVEKLDVVTNSKYSTTFYEPVRQQVAPEHHPVSLGGDNANWPPPTMAECLAAYAN